MSDEVPEDFKKKSNELWNEMNDNTQFDDNQNKLKFAKLCISAEDIDPVMDHYGFLDLVELNTMSIKLLRILSQMEKDGFRFCIFKVNKDNKMDENYEVDFHKVIHDIRLSLIKQKEKDEGV